MFTTIQKFAPETGETDYPVLTERRNVVVIADEAHRSQYGFRAKVERKTGEISYGFAKYLRDALPNASFIGFTGTPIEKEDVNTHLPYSASTSMFTTSTGVSRTARRSRSITRAASPASNWMKTRSRSSTTRLPN